MMMENKNVRPWKQYQALYLHIPFCVQKCLYCDFASYAGFGEQAKRDYTDAVCKEIALRAAEAANMAANGFNTSIAPRHVKTIRGPYKSKSGI